MCSLGKSLWLLLEVHVIVKLHTPLWTIELWGQATRAPQWSRGMGGVLTTPPLFQLEATAASLER